MTTRSWTLLPALASLTLAACGGSSSDGDHAAPAGTAASSGNGGASSSGGDGGDGGTGGSPSEKPQCSDSQDNDGDGLADYPEDPGCTSPSDGDETDGGAPPPPCDLHATTGDLESVFAGAVGPTTICLAAGDYGEFQGGVKAGRVFLRPEDGASVTIEIAFSGAENITVHGMTVAALDMSGSRDITISHVEFTGQAIVHAGSIADANILFDGNTHIDITTCDGCFAARLHIDPVGDEPTGVTIRNSLFDGSYSDGIRPDANAVTIEDCEFRNFDDMDPYHTDPIQIYGGRNVAIRRCFFHDNHVAAHIGGWDGNDHNVVEDNVFVGGPSTGEAIAMSSDDGSIIQHNTLVQGQCAYNWPCGILLVDHKDGDPPSNGTVVRDNILASIEAADGNITADHNLFTDQETPVYVGPPTTYAGYHLAAGSPGEGTASDGGNVGIH